MYINNNQLCNSEAYIQLMHLCIFTAVVLRMNCAPKVKFCSTFFLALGHDRYNVPPVTSVAVCADSLYADDAQFAHGQSK